MEAFSAMQVLANVQKATYMKFISNTDTARHIFSVAIRYGVTLRFRDHPFVNICGHYFNSFGTKLARINSRKTKFRGNCNDGVPQFS